MGEFGVVLVLCMFTIQMSYVIRPYTSPSGTTSTHIVFAPETEQAITTQLDRDTPGFRAYPGNSQILDDVLLDEDWDFYADEYSGQSGGFGYYIIRFYKTNWDGRYKQMMTTRHIRDRHIRPQ